MVQKTQTQAVVVKAEIQDQFNEKVQKQLEGTVWQSGCVSWYQQDGGKNFALWPTYTWKFWLETRRLNPSDFRLLGNKQKLQAKSQAA
jgi:cyclohexanone monooxygenase